MNEFELFQSALDIADPAARKQFLISACDHDAQMLSQVEALLASHEGQSQFLNIPVVVQIADIVDVADAGAAATDLIGSRSVRDNEPCATTIDSHGSDPMTEQQDDTNNEISLGFLESSTKPGSLGRLAHYEILEVVGRGAFGTVLRAFDEKLQRVVAIKIMAPELASTSPARKRFLREAQSSAAIRHENVVSVYAVEEKPRPYLVMEFVPGVTLQKRLDDGGPLDVPAVLRLGRQIAEGLAAAHAINLIHRDIKPGNILLETSVHDRVKITDFGLARAVDDASLTQSGTIAGTPMYMAPEQALGHKLDQRADLFSFGSVLYQMVSGRPPFRAPSAMSVLKRVVDEAPRPIQEIIPETPQWLCDIITKLHAKNPDERYQTAQEVADIFADCEAQLKSNRTLHSFSPLPAAKPARSLKWNWFTVGGLIGVILLLGMITLTFKIKDGKTTIIEVQDGTKISIDAETIMPGSDLAALQMTELGVPDVNGWVQLFNGLDLTGWKTHPDLPGEWRVNHGVLVGSKVAGYLFSEAEQFENFHLRIEANINHGGDSGIYFRAPFSMRPGRFPGTFRPAGGYEAEMHRNPGYQIRTGSLWNAESSGFAKALWTTTEDLLPKGNEWFVLEIIAQGNHFITKVNGIQTADCRDPESRFHAGHFALQVFNPQTVVQFRKIEIRELPGGVPIGDPGPDSKTSPPVASFTEAEIQRIAALPATEQVEIIRKELKRLNPKFDGTLTPTIKEGVVTGLQFLTDEVDNIEPVRALKGLTSLNCSGTEGRKGKLSDLSPLKGMALTSITIKLCPQFQDLSPLMGMRLNWLHCEQTGVHDLTPLKGMPLSYLNVWATKVTDLSPLEGMPLTKLVIGMTGVVDLSPLRGMPLRELWCQACRVSDLTPLKNMPLRHLHMTRTLVSDLSPLREMPLESLYFSGTSVSDLSPLRGMPLVELLCDGTLVFDLAPLQGLPLRDLACDSTPVFNLSPLKGAPLEKLSFSPQKITQGLDILRDMKSLKTIGISWEIANQLWPAPEFWERYDRGEFTK